MSVQKLPEMELDHRKVAPSVTESGTTHTSVTARPTEKQVAEDVRSYDNRKRPAGRV